MMTSYSSSASSTPGESYTSSNNIDTCRRARDLYIVIDNVKPLELQVKEAEKEQRAAEKQFLQQQQLLQHCEDEIISAERKVEEAAERKMKQEADGHYKDSAGALLINAKTALQAQQQQLERLTSALSKAESKLSRSKAVLEEAKAECASEIARIVKAIKEKEAIIAEAVRADKKAKEAKCAVKIAADKLSAATEIERPVYEAYKRASAFERITLNKSLYHAQKAQYHAACESIAAQKSHEELVSVAESTASAVSSDLLKAAIASTMQTMPIITRETIASKPANGGAGDAW